MAYSTKNYSFSSISRKFENENILELVSDNSFDQTTLLEFKNTIMFNRLKQQANVFAQDLIGLSFEKKFVLGARQELWLERSEQMYIMSFFRGITYGYYKGDIEMFGNDYYMFPGHLLLGKMMRQNSFSYSGEKINYYHSLAPSFSIDSDFIKRICQEFPFLSFQESENGKYTVRNADVSNYLSRLSAQNLRDLVMVDLASNPTSIFNLSNIDSVPLGNSTYIDLKFDDNNAPEKSDNITKFGFIANDSQNLNYNVSMWLAIANFIYTEDDKVNFRNKSYYETTNCFERDSNLVKYEVHANTYLRCSSIPDIKPRAKSSSKKKS